jgi:hypothetical protein
VYISCHNHAAAFQRVHDEGWLRGMVRSHSPYDSMSDAVAHLEFELLYSTCHCLVSLKKKERNVLELTLP